MSSWPVMAGMGVNVLIPSIHVSFISFACELHHVQRLHVVNWFITCIAFVADHVFLVYDPRCSVDCEHVDCHDGKHIPEGRRNREGMDTTGNRSSH